MVPVAEIATRPARALDEEQPRTEDSPGGLESPEQVYARVSGLLERFAQALPGTPVADIPAAGSIAPIDGVAWLGGWPGTGTRVRFTAGVPLAGLRHFLDQASWDDNAGQHRAAWPWIRGHLDGGRDFGDSAAAGLAGLPSPWDMHPGLPGPAP